MRHITLLFILLLISPSLVSCIGNPLDKTKVIVPENLETIQIKLIFKPEIHWTYSGSYAVGDYGLIYLMPWTDSDPFEVGLNLDTDVFSDNDLADLVPTMVLPNGDPLGTPYAVVQVTPGTQPSADFDLYGYVDVTHAKWMGVGAVLKKFKKNPLKKGFSVTKTFKDDETGAPVIVGSVYGPVEEPDGTITKKAGLAVVANAKWLIDQASQKKEPLEIELRF